MILPDVNVLAYAHRHDSTRHSDYQNWLERLLDSDTAFGVCDLVLSGFLRVVTHPRVFGDPTPLPLAMQFVSSLRNHPNAVTRAPGERHWDIFQRLCQEVNAKGNLVPDAYLAAFAIEVGAEWITTDRDYARFKSLHWKHPLS
ncbi:MAG: type II toxin-antitoxin system VapC family toxin [Nitrospira sp.]|nr:type II toxin-antitoxin system VapC family toxin [Nitrospira sp.]MDH4371241.1 type II toxin-antitoxin system VapC family toxin [Nitrospira sp.]MDH5348323.1 type II toxin-antitoxin system VapC family toxin [Nitrospira sp.]MDH5498778.1 type II toxin-antitoxin system VapC family toxin [Nitrospira sp.]MDH5726054.1 type II toxin-antitoxin system VapC family toxin [Nitrospira sp.]